MGEKQKVKGEGASKAESAEIKPQQGKPSADPQPPPKTGESKERAKTEGKEQYDPFVRMRLYPDPVALFSFCPPSLSDVRQEVLVVLDANTLLLPYTVDQTTLDDIQKVYTLLRKEKRLVVPGQVAREFVSHRPTKLLEIIESLQQTRNTIQGIPAPKTYPLLRSLPLYNELLEQRVAANKQQDACREKIDLIVRTLQGWYLNDPISNLYRTLFGADVVVDITPDEPKLLAELEWRVLHRIPPGYEDRSKADKGIGDLLIWKTILEVGQQRKAPLVFVSNDEKKGDWVFYRSDTRLYARHELVDEYRRASGGKAFYILKLADLLELYGAAAQSVAVVRQLERFSEEGELPQSALPPEAIVRTVIETWDDIADVNPAVFADVGYDFELVHRDGRRSIVVVLEMDSVKGMDVMAKLAQTHDLFSHHQRQDVGHVAAFVVSKKAQVSYAAKWLESMGFAFDVLVVSRTTPPHAARWSASRPK